MMEGSTTTPGAVAGAAAADAEMATSTAVVDEGAGSGAGPDKSKTTVNAIGAKLANADVLDVAFCMDCTASMGSYIAAAQRSIASIAEQIVSAEKADVRFALVEYRDHPPQDSSFVTRVHPFTGSISAVKRDLNACRASGGGDTPEAVADALHDCLKLDWRPEATKITVLVCDAPPHGLQDGGNDGFPDGSPNGIDPVDVCHRMAAAGITMYTVGCEPSINTWLEFFEGMSHITGGQYCGLSSAGDLSTVIVGGAREEMALERLMDDADAELDVMGADASEEAQANALYKSLSAKAATSTHLERRSEGPKSVSACAKKLKSKTSLGEYCTEWKASRSEPKYDPMRRMASTARGMAAPMRNAFAAEDKGSDDDGYDVSSRAVSMEQCARMVSKGRARKGWSSSGY